MADAKWLRNARTVRHFIPTLPVILQTRDYMPVAGIPKKEAILFTYIHVNQTTETIADKNYALTITNCN